MPKIHVLPEKLASKIAAGEVIERPASVVKELIENSLDAKAKRIIIQVENGGKKLIRVTDDGEGMAADDAQVAIQRHATSKISTLDDLASVSTLGFRGEALTSIAAVSRMKIVTCDGTGSGTEVVCVEGKVKGAKPMARERGTSVEVADLFFNLPARKKFMKADGVEYVQIQRLVRLYALAYDRVAFQLFNGEKLAYNAPGDGPGVHLFRGIFDRGIAEQMDSFHAETLVGKVWGYVTPAHVTTRTARNVYCFVNQRPVRPASLLPWIRDALRYVLPEGEFPYLILFLEVPPEQVDVNVHPAKWEVRFSNPLEGRSLVLNGVKEGLLGAKKPPGMAFTRAASPAPDSPVIRTGDAPTEQSIATPVSSRPLVPVAPPGEHRIVGQVFDTYIAVEQGEDFLLLDQHVVSERALFEALTTPALIGSQEMLLPMELALTDSERMVISESLDLLERVGIRFRHDDSGKLVLVALPFYLPPGKAEEQIRELADQLADSSALSLTALDERLRTMSCKLAIKANTPLSLKEMARLYHLWKEATNQHTCPHGRPIYFRLSKDEMGRHVGRSPASRR